MKRVEIFTDGACKGNPGPGGYGVILKFGENEKEISGGFKNTTNNRMEIYACLEGLRRLKLPCKVVLYSDSKYVVDSINKGWAKKWKLNGWMRNKKDRAENPDLWQELLTLCEKHNVSFEWVRGHANHVENERCDQLASDAACKDNLPIDKGYESKKGTEFLQKLGIKRDENASIHTIKKL